MSELGLTLILLSIAVVFFVWFGWRLRLAWKNFLFGRRRRRGAKGELDAVSLLHGYGYNVKESQVSIKGYLNIDGTLSDFEVRPDFLVEKDGVSYLAEVKTGKSAEPSNRITRRQLREYSMLHGGGVALLVDPGEEKVMKISFN